MNKIVCCFLNMLLYYNVKLSRLNQKIKHGQVSFQFYVLGGMKVETSILKKQKCDYRWLKTDRLSAKTIDTEVLQFHQSLGRALRFKLLMAISC